MNVPQFLRAIIITGEDDCWIWRKGKDRDGYGCVWFEGKFELAHRVAYRIFVGSIPTGLQVCHTCDTPPCCNPKHFFIGTQLDNIGDRVQKGRSYRKYLNTKNEDKAIDCY